MPTLAWRRVIDNHYNATHWDDQAHNITTDASGYAIFNYAVDGTGSDHWSRDAKIGPANNSVFDTGATTGFQLKNGVVTVSPLIGGTQYVWRVDTNTNSSPGGGYPLTFDCSTTTNPVPLTAGFTPFPAGDQYAVGTHVDASGNLMVAVNEADASGHHFLHMMTIAKADGTIISDHQNTLINPNTAYWNSATNTWIVAGNDPASLPGLSGRWGSYDPADGSEKFSDHANGSIIPGETFSQNYVVNPLPGNAIGVTLNAIDAKKIGGTTYSHTLQVRNAAYSMMWHYPATGTATGLGLQVASLSASAPVYAVGNPDSSNGGGNQFIDKFDWTGALQWHHTHQPVQKIYPTTEGFFGQEYYQASNTIFLEHYIDATNTYDWGRSYKGTDTGVPIMGGVALFQNFLYVMNSVQNTTTGYDLILERFVTGITLSSVSCASTIPGGTPLPVTIHLNGNVVGSPMTVALNSNSNAITMPNGKLGQNFLVPVGQDSIVVNLTTHGGVTTQVVLTAIQNGVRRAVATTVTP